MLDSHVRVFVRVRMLSASVEKSSLMDARPRARLLVGGGGGAPEIFDYCAQCTSVGFGGWRPQIFGCKTSGLNPKP